MVPLTTLFYPLAAIGISGLYATWHRARLARRAPAGGRGDAGNGRGAAADYDTGASRP